MAVWSSTGYADPDLYCSSSSTRYSSGRLYTVAGSSATYGYDSITVSPWDSWVPASPAYIYCTVYGYTGGYYTLQLVNEAPTPTPSASASPTQAKSPSSSPSPSAIASVALNIGASVAGTLQQGDKHYYSLLWAPPAGTAPTALTISVQPLSSMADPDLAASQYGPDPNVFSPQAVSTNGAGIIDSLTLTTTDLPLSAVLAFGGPQPKLYLRVSGFAAGGYVLSSAYVYPASAQAASPSSVARVLDWKWITTLQLSIRASAPLSQYFAFAFTINNAFGKRLWGPGMPPLLTVVLGGTCCSLLITFKLPF